MFLYFSQRSFLLEYISNRRKGRIFRSPCTSTRSHQHGLISTFVIDMYVHRYFLQYRRIQQVGKVLLITKTRLYNFDPRKPHFYIVKLGFTGVYIIFLISAQKHRLWVLVRTASERRFYQVLTIYVLSRNMKNIRLFI